jgi:hypothetical protein
MKDRDEQKGKPETPYRVYPDRAALENHPNFDTMQFFHLDTESRLGYSRYAPGTSNPEIVSFHLPMNVVRISGTYTVLETDDVLVAYFTGTTAINLPSATGTYNPIYLKLISSGTSAVLTPTNSEKIDGQTTYTMTNQYGSVMIMPCTFEWNILSNF